MTLMREMMADWNLLSMASIASLRTPSIRYLTLTSSSLDSMWMSLARFWTAVKMMVLTSLMIEPSWSASFSMEMTSSSSSPLVLLYDLDDEALGGVLEDLDGGFALPQGLVDGPLGGRVDLDLFPQEGLDGVDGGDVGGVGDGDLHDSRPSSSRGTKFRPVEELDRECSGRGLGRGRCLRGRCKGRGSVRPASLVALSSSRRWVRSSLFMPLHPRAFHLVILITLKMGK